MIKMLLEIMINGCNICLYEKTSYLNQKRSLTQKSRFLIVMDRICLLIRKKTGQGELLLLIVLENGDRVMWLQVLLQRTAPSSNRRFTENYSFWDRLVEMKSLPFNGLQDFRLGP